MVLIREDDEKALGTLMDRYWSPLLHYVHAQLRDDDDAEDVTQEVFVRTWEQRKSWKGNGSVQSYLYRIARNLIVDRARHRKVRQEALPWVRRLRNPPATPVEETVHSELRLAFENALAGLPPRRREAFVLVRFRGMSLKQAAGIMNLTPRTVANHIFLAVTDLESALDPYLT